MSAIMPGMRGNVRENIGKSGNNLLIDPAIEAAKVLLPQKSGEKEKSQMIKLLLETNALPTVIDALSEVAYRDTATEKEELAQQAIQSYVSYLECIKNGDVGV
jgi:hypothetical protein